MAPEDEGAPIVRPRGRSSRRGGLRNVPNDRNDPQIRHRGETRTTILSIIGIMTMVLFPVLLPLAVHVVDVLTDWRTA